MSKDERTAQQKTTGPQSLRERSADPERCQHGYLLTWKNCPGCRLDGVVLRHGSTRRKAYVAVQAYLHEARRDGCQECGGPQRIDYLALTDAVLEALDLDTEALGV